MNPNVIVDGSGSAPVNRESLKGVRPLEVVLSFITQVSEFKISKTHLAISSYILKTNGTYLR